MNATFDRDRVYRTLVDEAPDAVIYADVDGVIQYWNHAAERIFGFSEEEALERSLDIIIPEPLRARHWNGFAETLRTGVTRYGAGDVLAVSAQRKDGTRVSVEFTILPVHDEHQVIIGIAATLREVAKGSRGLTVLRKRFVGLAAHMTALHVERQVRCPFSLTIDLVEKYHTGHPDHRVGPFGWARAHVHCEASRVHDVSDRSRRHEAFSFTWRGGGWFTLPEVYGFITVRPSGVFTTLTLNGQYIPPFGVVGRVFDALLGRGLAQRSIERLMNDMVVFIEQSEERMRAAGT